MTETGEDDMNALISIEAEQIKHERHAEIQRPSHEEAYRKVAAQEADLFYGPDGIAIRDASFLSDDVKGLLLGAVGSVNASSENPISPLQVRREGMVIGLGSAISFFESDKSHDQWRLRLHTADGESDNSWGGYVYISK